MLKNTDKRRKGWPGGNNRQDHFILAPFTLREILECVEFWKWNVNFDGGLLEEKD